MEPTNPPTPAATPTALPPTPPAAPAVPAIPAVAAVPATIQFDEFAKVDLRVATILDAQPHPNADKLLVLQIDLGTEKRQICAGIRAYYQPADLVGKQIIVVANLAPRTLRGQVSHGMLLAAHDAAGTGNVVIMSPSGPVGPGSKVS